MNIEDDLAQVYGANNSKSIGIDVGVKVFAYTSENQAIKHSDIRKEIANVIKAQKVLSRRKKEVHIELKQKPFLQKSI